MGFYTNLNSHATMSPHLINPLPDDKILDWSNLEETADDILKFI